MYREIDESRRIVQLRSGAGIRRKPTPLERRKKQMQREIKREENGFIARVCQSELGINRSSLEKHNDLAYELEVLCKRHNWMFYEEAITWEREFNRGHIHWDDTQNDFSVAYFPPSCEIHLFDMNKATVDRYGIPHPTIGIDEPTLRTRRYRSSIKTLKTAITMLQSHIRWERRLEKLRRRYGYQTP